LADEPESIAHDSVKRLLDRQPHHTEALYEEAKWLFQADEGVIVIDDSTFNKPYSNQMVVSLYCCKISTPSIQRDHLTLQR
jgi:hypothetical protein